VDMSPARDQEYFTDGLSEELLNALAKIPELRVAARTSSFQFKGKTADVASIGRQLRVGTILEGSVRKAGRHVRITAQLVKVEDGFELWSETYDRELDDIFGVQEDIARSVSSALKLRLLGEAGAPGARGNADAYNLYLQGRYFADRRTREDLEKAVSYYQQALKLDPRYARAWVGLADAHSDQADQGSVPLAEGYRKAHEEVDKALELDPDLAEAHAALGRIRLTYDWDWSGADATYKRALELEPGDARVVREAANLAATLGRFDEALRLDRRAAELDPLSVTAHYRLGLHTSYVGRLDEAEAAFHKALDLNPEYPAAHALLGRVFLARSKAQAALEEIERETEPSWRRYGLALAYHALGRKGEADAALAELLEKDSEGAAFQIAEVYAFRGEKDKAFEWLERAYAQRDGGLSQMKGDPLLRSLESDPRYAAFLKKMRLPL
jgi:TolB-like protein/Tfp pilus assembly protein PilF